MGRRGLAFAQQLQLFLSSHTSITSHAECLTNTHLSVLVM
jgi:hypothetical protein